MVEIIENFDFGQNVLEISILVDVLWNILILAMFLNILFLSAFLAIISGFGQKIWKSRFWSKFSIISILVEIVDSLDIGQKILTISIIVKKSSKNLAYGKTFSFSNISISFQIFENVDFGQNFRKISILVTIFKNLDFAPNVWKLDIGQRFRKILILAKNSGNLLSAFRKIISILVKIFEHLDFG